MAVHRDDVSLIESLAEEALSDILYEQGYGALEAKLRATGLRSRVRIEVSLGEVTFELVVGDVYRAHVADGALSEELFHELMARFEEVRERLGPAPSEKP